MRIPNNCNPLSARVFEAVVLQKVRKDSPGRLMATDLLGPWIASGKSLYFFYFGWKIIYRQVIVQQDRYILDGLRWNMIKLGQAMVHENLIQVALRMTCFVQSSLQTPNCRSETKWRIIPMTYELVTKKHPKAVFKMESIAMINTYPSNMAGSESNDFPPPSSWMA